MNVGINHSGFNNTTVYGLRELLKQETVIRKKNREVKMVTDILAVKVWTQDDVNLETQTELSRLWCLCHEMDMRYFQVIDVLNPETTWNRQRKNGGPNESPFWVCTSDVKTQVCSCVTCHIPMRPVSG